MTLAVFNWKVSLDCFNTSCPVMNLIITCSLFIDDSVCVAQLGCCPFLCVTGVALSLIFIELQITSCRSTYSSSVSSYTILIIHSVFKVIVQHSACYHFCGESLRSVVQCLSSFNIIRFYFIISVIRDLAESENEDVNSAAKGALWKLEGEAEHLQKLEAKKQSSEPASNKSGSIIYQLVIFNMFFL